MIQTIEYQQKPQKLTIQLDMWQHIHTTMQDCAYPMPKNLRVERFSSFHMNMMQGETVLKKASIQQAELKPKTLTTQPMS